MVRSKWMKALVLAVASTGLVRGQTTSSPYAAGAGKTTQPAAVVPAAVNTPTSPTPRPPGPPTQPRLTPTAAGSAQAAAGETVITVQEAGKPAQRCKVLKTWKMKDGSIASQVQALDTGETMTIVEDGKGDVVTQSVSGGPIRDVASRIFHWGRGKPPAGVPMPPDEGATALGAHSQIVDCKDCVPPGEPKAFAGAPAPLPVVVSSEPKRRVWPPAHTTSPVATRQELANVPAHKGMADPSTRRVEAAPPLPVVVNTPKPPTPVTQTAQVETKPGKPGDWRQSWGKPEPTPKTEAPKVVTKVDPPKVTAKVDPPKPPMKVNLPVADKNRVDPLKSPTAYNRHTMDDKILNKPAAAPVPASMPASMPATLPPASTEVVSNNVPLGAQSVIQSGTTNYVPVPVVTLPDVRRPQAGPGARPPMPPSPNARMMNSFTAAPTPPAPVDTPADMANAFTPAQQTPVPETVVDAGAFGQGQPVPAAALPYPPAYYQAMMARGMVPGQGHYPQMPGYGVQPGYLPPAQPGYATTAPGAPVGAERMMTPTGPTSSAQLLGVLKESMYPSQREWAATRLAEYNGGTQPTVVDGLARAAKEDPAAIVRAACVRSLAKMGVANQRVTAALQACKADVDPRVVQEAELALGGQSSPILPTSDMGR
jgi:hypothetical protein